MSAPAAATADPRRAAGASGLVVAGLVAQEFGAAIAVLLFPSVGALGVVALRLGFSAIVLMAIARPRLRGRSRRDWLTVVGFGLSIAVMNALFYEALSRVPLGTTVTIEVLGPLVLAVVLGRRWLNALWAVLAFAAVTVLAGVDLAGLDPIGVLFAFGAAACWSAYILASGATGRRFGGVDGLALAMTLGGVLSVPLALATVGPAFLAPQQLLLGLGVAVLSSAIPYAFELIALRRIPSAAFGVLMSLAPATAATVGAFVLHQWLHPLQIAAIAVVVIASAGSVLTAPRRARAEAEAPTA